MQISSKDLFGVDYNQLGIKNPVSPIFVTPGIANNAGVKSKVGQAVPQATQTPISPSGNVQSSTQVGYDSGVGWWIGFDKGIPKLFIGNSASNKLLWDGETLTIDGNFIIGQLSITVSPGDNIQDAIDILTATGGGTLYLKAGTFNVNYNIVLTDNIRILGIGSGGSIIDFGNGAFQIQAIGTLLNTVDSVFLQGFTVQNSSVELIKAQYVFNFGGYDVRSINGSVGFSIDNGDTFNWNVGYVDTCAQGMSMTNMTGMTVSGTFLTNITANGGYVCDTCTNSIIFNSSLDGVVGNGYDMTACTNFGVQQVSILNVTGIGFKMDGCGESFSISEGLIDTSSSDGMKLQNTTSTIQVTTMQFSNNTGYGVNVSDAGSTNNLFVGNTFVNNTAGNFHNLGTTTLIRSNIGVADN